MSALLFTGLKSHLFSSFPARRRSGAQSGETEAEAKVSGQVLDVQGEPPASVFWNVAEKVDDRWTPQTLCQGRGECWALHSNL